MLPLTKAAGGSSTGEADDHEARAKRKRATSDAGDREADVDAYKYDANEKFQPTRKRNKKGGVSV